MPDLPVACSLTDPEFREREQALLARLRARILEAMPEGEGWRLRVDGDDETLALVAEVISAERQCCPFLRFDLRVTEGGGPVELLLSGPAGTREFIAPWFEPTVSGG